MATAPYTPPFLLRLGLDTAADERVIRRAYARQIKQIDAELQATEFQALREAYEHALSWLKWQQTKATQAAQEAVQGVLEQKTSSEAPLAAKIPLSQTPAEPAQDSAAGAVFMFASFLVKLQGDGATALDQARCASDLKEQLADSRLISLITRAAFEQALVGHLTAGWKPGNDILFTTAIDAFRWNEGRNGLHHFGRAGALLNRAIMEWEILLKRVHEGSGREMELLVRMRNDKPASIEERLRYDGLLLKMMPQFSTLLPIVTNMDNKAKWQAPVPTLAQIPASGNSGSYSPYSPYLNAPGSLSLKNTPPQSRANDKRFPYLAATVVGLSLLFGLFVNWTTSIKPIVSNHPQPERHTKPVAIPITLPTPSDRGFHPILPPDQAAVVTEMIRPNIIGNKAKFPAKGTSAHVRYLISVDSAGLPTATVLETTSGSWEFDVAVGHAIAFSGPYPHRLISPNVPVLYSIGPEDLQEPNHEH